MLKHRRLYRSTHDRTTYVVSSSSTTLQTNRVFSDLGALCAPLHIESGRCTKTFQYAYVPIFSAKCQSAAYSHPTDKPEPRVVAVGAPHHVTQRGNYRQTVFHADDDRLFYLADGDRPMGTRPMGPMGTGSDRLNSNPLSTLQNPQNALF